MASRRSSGTTTRVRTPCAGKDNIGHENTISVLFLQTYLPHSPRAVRASRVHAWVKFCFARGQEDDGEVKNTYHTLLALEECDASATLW